MNTKMDAVDLMEACGVDPVHPPYLVREAAEAIVSDRWKRNVRIWHGSKAMINFVAEACETLGHTWDYERKLGCIFLIIRRGQS